MFIKNLNLKSIYDSRFSIFIATLILFAATLSRAQNSNSDQVFIVSPASQKDMKQSVLNFTDKKDISCTHIKFDFIVTHREEGLYIADYYQQPCHGFQNRIAQNKFASKSKLNTYLSHFKVVNAKMNLGLFKQIKTQPISELENSVIWQAKENWSQDWEVKYAEWVTENISSVFFQANHISTDCADVAIASRWIFSRIHHLAMASSLAGTERLFTNESMLAGWAKLPTAEEWNHDQRFMAALSYVLDNTYTHTLAIDSYPVALTPEIFLPGVHHLNLYSEETGHTMFVNEINRKTGGILMVYSSTPQAARELWTDYFHDSLQYSSEAEGGFLKIRWAKKINNVWGLVPEEEMPGYSLEQYDENFSKNFGSYADALEARLGAQATPKEKFRQLLQMLNDRLTARKTVVDQGFVFCQSHDCSEGTINFENWSTPSRDSKITQLINYASDKAYESNDSMRQWQKFNNNSSLEVDGRDVKYTWLIQAFSNDKCSHDPRDQITARWGI